LTVVFFLHTLSFAREAEPIQSAPGALYGDAIVVDAGKRNTPLLSRVRID
jgi:hypothetical protein